MIICLGATPTVQRTMSFARLSIDAVNRATSAREFASGKSTNVARVLHTLGNAVLATGFIGGERAAFFRADLDRSGIAHDFVTVRTPTRLCITAVDQANGTATELIEESAKVADDDYDLLLATLQQHLPRAQLLVLSGSLPPGAPTDFYRRCVELAGARVRVILDAVGAPLLEALPAWPFVVKPNQAELGRTLHIDPADEAALRDGMLQLAARGASWVVCTRGRDGAIVTDGTRFWKISSAEVKVVNPIGSGDAFTAGLASSIAKGENVPQACVPASACGSANAMTPDAGHVRPNDVEALAPQIRIEPL